MWLWVAIEPENGQILALSISKERNIFVAEKFISRLVMTYGKRNISPEMVLLGTPCRVDFLH